MENANVKTNNKNNTIIFNTDIPKDPDGYWRGEFLGHKVFTTHKEVLEYLADLTVKHIDPDSIISSIRVNVCL